jgi:hypothetical protein
MGGGSVESVRDNLRRASLVASVAFLASPEATQTLGFRE